MYKLKYNIGYWSYKMDNEVIKKQFLMVFSNDARYQWALEYKKQYIYALNQSLDNETKDLPEKLITKPATEIFDTVKKYDTHFNLFIKFHKNYELYSKKTIEIYNVDYYKDDINKISKIAPVNYSLEASDEWKNIGVIKEDSKTSFIYAQNSYDTATSKIDASSFSDEVWDEIALVANKKTSVDNGRLLYISAKVVSPQRKILKLTTDTEKNLFMISYDSTDVDKNGKKIDIADSNRSALNSIIPTLPFSDKLKKEISNSYEQGSNKVITKKALDDLSFLNEDNILVIPTTNTINIENKQTTEHCERLTSEHYNLKSPEIIKAAKTEYINYGTFKQFFTHFPKYNTKNDKLKTINIDEKIENKENESYHAYIIIVREAKNIEKPLSDEGFLANKVINILSVDFDYSNNEMTIKNSNYSGESHDVIIHKLLELSK